MTATKRLAVSVRAPADIIPHLGSPTHWRQGRSAKALADAWTQAAEFPKAVEDVLRQAPEYAGAELLDGWFERETDLQDGQGRASQTDLLALISSSSGLAILAVEAKVDEPFGETVGEWLNAASPGKLIRLEQLCRTLGLEVAAATRLRYQLLHRTTAAILEAKRFRAPSAVVLVHSFCPSSSGLSDFSAFAEALGYAPVKSGMISEPRLVGGVEVRLAWVTDEVPPGKDLPSVQWLTDFGRTRLSKNFFMRDFLFSEIAAIHGFSNIPRHPELAIEAGSKLCSELLEPLQEQFGRIAVRSAYRSPQVNGLGATMQRRGAKGYSCASNERNAGAHIWDELDENGERGATACVVVPAVYDRFKDEEGGWQRLAWWIHDHLPYSELTFFPTFWAFNIRWQERPRRCVRSYIKPTGTLTAEGMANHDADHRECWQPLMRG